MRRVGLIGGTGAQRLVPADAARLDSAPTPWGLVSSPMRTWRAGKAELFFLHRHGEAGAVAPHRVNYRANVWALREAGVEAIIGINAVGGITAAATPGRIVLPHQLIDYTWGREHTYCDGSNHPLRHVEFDPPFDESLRRSLAAVAGTDTVLAATYGVTQGPRLETAAEIDRLAADGCDVVGMTAMPEAGLAREAGLPYAICAVVVNRAAGRLSPGESIHGQMQGWLEQGMAGVAVLLARWLAT